MPRVSVIIPTFNREHLIQRTIESVFNQTYSDLEIIVCDDGSKDRTVEVVKGIMNKAPLPIRLEELPKNLGVSAARNWGIFCARGELIGFLDSDDTWKPEKLEKQVAFIDAEPAYVGVSCAVTNVLPDGREVIFHDYEVNVTKQNELFTLINACYITTSCFLVKKTALILSGMFDIRLKSSEDRDLWWRLPRFGRIGHINEPLINYRVHQESLSNQFSCETGKTYLPAIMKTIWYWRDRLTNQQIKQIYAKSYKLFSYDSSNAGNHFEAIVYAYKSMAYGGNLIAGIKFVLYEMLRMLKIK